MVNTFRAAMLVLLVLSITSSVSGQTPAPPTGKATAPGLIKLTGDEEKRAKALVEQIDKSLHADRWDEAIMKTKELLALRTRLQGPKHYETVNAEWRLKALRRVTAMPKHDRVAYVSAIAMNEQAKTSKLTGSTPGPSRFSRRRWRSSAVCSPTTTPTPPQATTTWRTTSPTRESTRRHSHCMRRRWS